MTEVTARASKPRRIKDRGRIFASGALAVVAIALAVLVVLNPLTATRADLRQIATDGVPLQAQLVELRTTVVDWQFFIERHLDELAPRCGRHPTEVVKGAGSVEADQAGGGAGSRHLRKVGFTTDARNLDAAMSVFSKTLPELAPAVSGTSIDPAKLRTIVASERAALEHVWILTTQIGRHLSQDITRSQTAQAIDHLRRLIWFLVVTAAIVALVILTSVTVIAGLRGPVVANGSDGTSRSGTRTRLRCSRRWR